MAVKKARVRKTKSAKKPNKPKKMNPPRQKRAKRPKNYSYRLSGLNPKTPKQLPETEMVKNGMTLRQLLRSTPRLMMNNSLDVKIVEFTKTRTKSGLPAIKGVTVTKDPFRPDKVERRHNTFIIGMETINNDPVDKPLNRHKKVICSCSCESYMYTFEYANAAHGASRIVYGNGDPPVVTNPKLAPGLCKHLVALATKLIKTNT